MPDTPFMTKRRAREILRESWGQRQPLTAEHHHECDWAKLPNERSSLDTLCRIGETLRPRDFVTKASTGDQAPLVMVGRTAGEDPARAYFANLPDD